MPQKEPSPLLDKKIEELEDLGDDDGEGSDAQGLPQLQTPLASDLDMMQYTPTQVCEALPSHEVCNYHDIEGT